MDQGKGVRVTTALSLSDTIRDYLTDRDDIASCEIIDLADDQDTVVLGVVTQGGQHFRFELRTEETS